MKSLVSLLLLLITFSNVSGQYTPALLCGNATGMECVITNPLTNLPETRFAGTITAAMTDSATGPQVQFYFYDIKRPAEFSIPRNDYFDDIVSNGINPFACYVATHFFPGTTGLGQHSDISIEAAAVQLSIWHFVDNLQISSIEDDQVRARVSQIVSTATANGNGCFVRLPVEYINLPQPEFFRLKTVDDNGDPIALDSISLYYDLGVLSTYNVSTTLPDGLSEEVEVSDGYGILDAHHPRFTFPRGSLFRNINPDFPRLTLATPGYGHRSITYNWGQLPVELVSFNAIVDKASILLSWTTSSETNNSHFQIERSSGQNVWETVGRVDGAGNSIVQTTYSFKDFFLPAGKYSYRLKQYDYNGNFEVFALNQEVVIARPDEFDMSQNFPNPFNPATTIQYSIGNDCHVRISVFDISGKELAVLVNDFRTAGYYRTNLSADKLGLSSGTYFYRIVTDRFTKTLKMNLLK